MNHRPYGLLAELTYRCPLHCPYCSNPLWFGNDPELTPDEWALAFDEAAELGVLQTGLSGGEPLVRPDLASIVAAAHSAGLYTNLISSGIGLTSRRAEALREAGLQSVQLSFQAHEPMLADRIAGTAAHDLKLAAVAAVRGADLALNLNVVLHRGNIEHLQQMIDLAAELGASRLEVAHAQYYGWAHHNRAHLLPSRAQVEAARRIATEAISRHIGRMAIVYVLPDLFESRPKPCMHGWGRRFLTVQPDGTVLPCPTANAIPDLKPDSVRHRPLTWIWHQSQSFNRFRGTEWMPEPCQSCPHREVDFGGCRCQAALITGDPAATDPVCDLSPHRRLVDEIGEKANQGASLDGLPGTWTKRRNPEVAAALPGAN